MDKRRYLDAFRTNQDALVAAVGLGLEPRVPGCPAWTVGALAAHVTGVHLFWNKRLHSPAGSNSKIEAADLVQYPGLDGFRESESPDLVPPGVLNYLIDAGARLGEGLADASPNQDVDTWFPPDQTAGFVQRRMAQETAVHRWDAQEAHGIAQPIEPELARDGIDEVFDVMLTARREWIEPRAAGGETYHFHRTDGEGEWSIAFRPDGVEITPKHGKGDVAFCGTASELLLFLWGRIPASRLEVIGDDELVDRWFALVPPD